MQIYHKAYETIGYREDFMTKFLAHSPIEDADLRNLLDDGTKDTPLAKEAWLSYGLEEDFSFASTREDQGSCFSLRRRT